MASQSAKIQDVLDLFPNYFEKQHVDVQAGPFEPDFLLFNVHQAKFAQLADAHFLHQHYSQLIKVDIRQELNALTDEHQLEVSVPVLGLTDLLPNAQLQPNHLMFAAPVAINGFGAGEATHSSLALPDFLLATDIMGNQYEIVLNNDGTIELPQEGTGLFSMLSYLTFIYSAWQINKGTGLTTVAGTEIEPGYLYLLPPMSPKDFYANLAVTHLDDHFQRKVDHLREVDVTMHHAQQEPELLFQLKQHHELENAVDLSLSSTQSPDLNTPYFLKFSLSPVEGADFSLSNPINPLSVSSSRQGWHKSPLEENAFVKQIGLSADTKLSIIRDVYSEIELTKDYLDGDHFGISNQNGYNNFIIYPEALGHVYDLVTEGIVSHAFSADFLWDRVADETILSLDLQHLPVNFFDSILLNDTLAHQDHASVDTIKSWFDSPEATPILEHLTLYTNHAITEVPQAQASFVYDMPEQVAFTDIGIDNVLSAPQVDIALTQSFDGPVALSMASDKSALSVMQFPTDAQAFSLQVEDVISFESESTVSGHAVNAPLLASLSKNPVFGDAHVTEAGINHTPSTPIDESGWHFEFTQIPDGDM